MNYNDFPILTNLDYELINKQYSNETFDRKNQLTKICQNLDLCRQVCFEIEHFHNIKVKTSLQNTFSTTTKLLDNLTCTFNISISKKNEIFKTTIFSLLKILSEIISLFSIWLKNEKKEYYMSMCLKTQQELSACLNNILNSLEESNILTFKHM